MSFLGNFFERGRCSSGEARAMQGSIFIFVYYWGTRTDGRKCGHRYGPNVNPRAAGGIFYHTLLYACSRWWSDRVGLHGPKGAAGKTFGEDWVGEKVAFARAEGTSLHFEERVR